MTAPDDPWAVHERERPVTVRPAPPQQVVWRLLHSGAAAEQALADGARRDAARRDGRTDYLARQIAEVLHRLDREPPDTAPALLPGVADRLRTALAGAGLRYLDPRGEPYDEVSAWADAEGSAPREGTERPVVAETLQPGLLSEDGRLLQRARVYLAVPPPATAPQVVPPPPAAPPPATPPAVPPPAVPPRKDDEE